MGWYAEVEVPGRSIVSGFVLGKALGRIDGRAW